MTILQLASEIDSRNGLLDLHFSLQIYNEPREGSVPLGLVRQNPETWITQKKCRGGCPGTSCIVNSKQSRGGYVSKYLVIITGIKKVYILVDVY